MRYPVNIEKDGEGFFVSFPDIPEALTCGDDLEDAFFMAKDALLTAFTFYFDGEEKIPAPSVGDYPHYVEVPASVSAKILLLNTMVDAKITKSQLGRLVGVKRQNVAQLLDVFHTTKIDTIEKALNGLGKQLELTAA